MPNHFHWPKTLLTSVKVESLAELALIIRDDASSDVLICLLFRHRWLPVVKRIGSAVPLSRDITVTVKRYDCLRMRLQYESGHQREIATGRMPDHGDTIWVNPK